MRNVNHLWPELPAWLDGLRDTRFQPFVDYAKQFLFWEGLLLFAFELGSRRQIDYDIREMEGAMLENLNRLAGAKQESLPVHDTVEHLFVDHMGVPPVVNVQTLMVKKLIRGKVLDRCRILSYWQMTAIDGTGYVSFKKRHCPRCLKFKTPDGIRYRHHVLEAKIVGPGGLAISIAHEMIENPEGQTEEEYEKNKQDCELKAFLRLARWLAELYPGQPICILADSMLACGPAITVCEENRWKYVFTFKRGRTPALWDEFKSLQAQSPQNSRHHESGGTKFHYQWVNGLHYDDSESRHHEFNALEVHERTKGKHTTFAWITNLLLDKGTVIPIAEQGGHGRWIIENQGFNYQKNSGLNMEHAYSHHPDGLKIFYTLLQIAHMIMQLTIKSSPLRKLAERYDRKDAVHLFGSLKNIPKLLLQCFRYYRIPDSAFDPHAARRFQLRLDTS